MTDPAADPLAWVGDELDRLDREGLRRPTRICRTLPGGRVEMDGRELWNFGSNDYLGLASEALVTQRLRGASALPHGATASPAVVGRSPEIAELERTIAEFEGTEDAVVFPTGYAANLGTVSALTGPGDAVFVERDCHACLVDGAKLGGGRLRVWRRDDPERLERSLAKERDARRRWILTEQVFSMDGDGYYRLRSVLVAARKAGAVVICDAAHATGIYPRQSWQTTSLEKIWRFPHERLVLTGTLSKAVGAAGGFVAASKVVCDYLRHAAKSHIFSTALPPAVAATATANLLRIQSDPTLGERVRRSARFLSRRLTHADLPVSGSGESPILPVILNQPDAAVRASERLADAGFFVPAIRPPTVRRGTSRLRISLSAAHPHEAVDGLADALIALFSSSPETSAA
ncbi:aminotransferase class I/II-fold pyridoxal phosphate-dependent enzyme [Alienimonas chondri]|uniref:8-amino-7-oxononanoate synthase n=1 Tax=Alienimonas chondri TaxID=2681879 RepID=A0ABX1VE06_9PLAN|nr:aminotransferase class I/II-fold pyridoxal phosphate-dependent enzyme [Alienimonas chondri]NNJ26137.1 8-amino-7-oxononanoate synthase [Alienimonas chondri]